MPKVCVQGKCSVFKNKITKEGNVGGIRIYTALQVGIQVEQPNAESQNNHYAGLHWNKYFQLMDTLFTTSSQHWTKFPDIMFQLVLSAGDLHYFSNIHCTELIGFSGYTQHVLLTQICAGFKQQTNMFI